MARPPGSCRSSLTYGKPSGNFPLSLPLPSQKSIMSCSHNPKCSPFCPGAIIKTPFLHRRHHRNSFLSILPNPNISTSTWLWLTPLSMLESPTNFRSDHVPQSNSAPMCRFVPTTCTFLDYAELFWTSRSTIGNHRKSSMLFTPWCSPHAFVQSKLTPNQSQPCVISKLSGSAGEAIKGKKALYIACCLKALALG